MLSHAAESGFRTEKEYEAEYGPRRRRKREGAGLRMWPTPVTSDCKGGISDDAFRKKDRGEQMKRMSFLKDAVLHGFPTPCTTGFSNGSGNVNRANELYEQGVLSEEERRSFRAGNGGKLNPDWVEALMFWPSPGWTSLEPMRREDFRLWKERAAEGTLWAYDPAELPEDDERYLPRTKEGIPHRADRLKAIGNGQVPSAAALAETILQRVLEKYR